MLSNRDVAGTCSRLIVHTGQPEPFRHRHVGLGDGARVVADGGLEIEWRGGSVPEGLGQPDRLDWPLAYLRTTMTILILIRTVAIIRGRSFVRCIARSSHGCAGQVILAGVSVCRAVPEQFQLRAHAGSFHVIPGFVRVTVRPFPRGFAARRTAPIPGSAQIATITSSRCVGVIEIPTQFRSLEMIPMF